MTSIREAQERLSKAQADLADASRKMRMGEFAASIAHEVTQPLAGILTNAESCLQWLAKEQPNLEKARQAAERITRDGNRAAKVIRSIREQAHNVVPKMALVDLNRLIGETLELIQSDLQRNDIFLDTQLNAAVGPIRGDPTQLQQVIVNLVMNAIEAMRTSGMTRVLRVLTQPETTKVLVSVEDSGPGIDATNAQRIFEPAFTTKTHGMGLGLAICRSIVEEHGGRIWWCANPGGGSIFRFALPLPG
jgi:C4-dicarboxylate-specific signal transduction histidine kinase